MFRKLLFTGIAIVIVVCLVAAAGCGTASIAGTYVNQGNPEQYLELKKDGTFWITLGNNTSRGEWDLKDDTLRATITSGGGGITLTGQVRGNEIVDLTGSHGYGQVGTVWVKQ